MKYIIEKAKGGFYAGSEKIAAKGLTLRRYLDLNSIVKMAKGLHLTASSVVFRGLTKGEQNKVLGKKRAPKPWKKAKKATKKARARR